MRVYPYSIGKNEIKKLAGEKRAEHEKQMPDQYQLMFLQEEIPQDFIVKIQEESAATNIKILTMLNCFATKREGRAELLRWGILEIILPF